MSDETVIVLGDGSQWKPASSVDTIVCATADCDNIVDTPAEIASYPSGTCPSCGNNWLGTEKRSTSISVTAPEAISGDT